MAFQDFDIIQNRRKQERQQRLRRRITIAVVSVVLVLVVVAAAIGAVMYMNRQQGGGSSNNQRSKSNANANGSTPKPVVAAEQVIKSACSGTDYKETCESSLIKAVKKNVQAQPNDIVKASFVVVSEEIDKVIKEAKGLNFNTPMKKAAFDDCLELLSDAKEELNSSMSAVHDWSKVTDRKPDINNWLSAVLSYQETCIDGFPDGPEKESMEKFLKNAKELGSNALAIMAESSTVLSKLGGSDVKRNLLTSDASGYPGWMDKEHRRMLKADATKFTPNAIVAKDGSGNFTTVNAALKAIPEKYKGRYVIYIKEGIYAENVIVTKKMVNITMYGDGSKKSIITGNKNYVDGVPTFQTATFAALGEGFMAQSLGFRNTAGPEKHQAVALRVQADRSMFINCRMEGFQDTLYVQTHRQFYRSCYITGTVDFIFGDAAAVLQNCMIYVRKPMDNQKNIVTAQGRMDKRATTGIVLQNCKILADDKLEPEKAKFKSYLGRPWKEYSRTIVMESEIGDLIDPAGWLEWQGSFALKTLYYAEFSNKGPGASTKSRVKWAGVKVLKKDEAMKFTVGPFLQGEQWLKSADVPVRFGMFT